MTTRGHLIDKVALVKIADHSTAATDAVTSAAVDMAGFDGALFFTSFGTAAANNSIKLQQSDDDGVSDGYSDIAGSSVASGTSDEDVWIDIQKPTKRYLKLVATRGTSSTLESIYVQKYDARSEATSNVLSGTITGKRLVAPAEGTA
jgi:hypothetical protein